MENAYFEEVHRAEKGYPYINPDTGNLSYVVHFHDEAEIDCVREGETVVVSETGSFEAKQGDICLFMPGELHGFVSRGENNIFVMKAVVTGAEGQEGFLDLSKIRLLKNVITKRDAVYQKLLSYVQDIQTEHAGKKPGFEYAVNALSLSAFVEVLRGVGFRAVTTKQSAQIAESMKLLRHAERFVEQNYMRPVSLEEMADYCNFSKYYFSHYFKKVTGVSFFYYLTVYRLERAMGLMKSTNHSMTEISYQCGFGSTRSFNRLFKKHFGVTPTEFRDQ